MRKPLSGFRFQPLFALLTLWALALASACGSTAAGRVDVAAELDLAQRRAIFEGAWSGIARKHFDPALGGVDWNAVHDKYAPRVDACTTRDELSGILAEMTGELGHSHVNVMAPAADVGAELAGEGESGGVIGLRASWVEDGVLVTGVDPDSPAAAAGILGGDQLLAIDGHALDDLESRLGGALSTRWRGYVSYFVGGRLTGRAGSEVTLRLADPSGAEREVTIERVAAKIPPLDLGFLGAMDADFETRQLENGALYIRFTPCMTYVQELVQEALEENPDAKGVILDLRGNPGGLGAVAMGVSRFLVNRDVELGTMRMRKNESEQFELHFNVNASPAAYTGPLVLLTDSSTASTAEILAGGLQACGRARIVGTTTMGAALPATVEELPGGWRLMTVVADFQLPNGELIEGTGVVPDVHVSPLQSDYADGGDPYLAAALRELSTAPTMASVRRRADDDVATSAAARKAPVVVDFETSKVMDRIVEELGGEELLRGIRSMRSRVRVSIMGIEGTGEQIQLAPNRSWTRMDLAGIGTTLEAFDGTRAWSVDPFQGARELKGVELAARRRAARIDANAAWRELYAKVEIIERKRDGGRDSIVLRQTPHPGEGAPETVFVDAGTYLPYRIETETVTPMGSVPIVSEIIEYGTQGTLRFPKRIRMRAGGTEVNSTVDSVELNVEVDPSIFRKPDEAQDDESASAPRSVPNARAA